MKSGLIPPPVMTATLFGSIFANAYVPPCLKELSLRTRRIRAYGATIGRQWEASTESEEQHLVSTISEVCGDNING
jgi:hypothetical protein